MRRDEQIEQIARDCIYYRGNKPCMPHERTGEHCRCSMYAPHSAKVLIIQISSAAAVIRSNALVERVKAEDPNCHITYLCGFPELLDAGVDEPLSLDAGNVLRCQMDNFDVLYNLDMDKRACAIVNIINAQSKKGFYLRQGQCLPLDEDSQTSYLRALMPPARGQGRPHPLQEMFGICGFEYRYEKPRLKCPQNGFQLYQFYDELVVGFNTGAEYPSTVKPYWEPERWISLIEMLGQQGLGVALLSQAQPDRFNEQIARETSLEYIKPSNWGDVIVSVNQCDVIVTPAGAVFELALALGKNVVLLEDRYESGIDAGYLHGQGTTVAPFDNAQERGSLKDILPDRVGEAVLTRISHLPEQKSTAQSDDAKLQKPHELSAVRDQVAHTRRGPD